MATIPTNQKDTAQLIYAAYAALGALELGFRQHLGASLIGDPCRRKLWYIFRGATKPNHSGRVLRLFRRGQEEELTFADDLRSIGCTLHTVDPETGEQFRVSACGGHFGGSLDGALVGLPGAPARWHVVEMKTHNDKSFKALCKDGVEKSKPLHYVQMQVYMHLTGMCRALYLAVNKNDDSIYSERVHYHEGDATRAIQKAHTIICAAEPLERISEDPGWYECQWCDHRDVCHKQKVPEVHCRTCAYATPEVDGTWSCSANGVRDPLSYEEQLRGCSDHLFIPALIPYAVMVENIGGIGVKYRMADGRVFYNTIEMASTPGKYTSKELQALDPALIGDPGLDEIRERFNAVVRGA